ncbi:MAG: iron-containing alcohol dehydrogenase [Pseudomonadota bacterium]
MTEIHEDAGILLPQEWTFPVPIAYGPGRLSEIGSRCSAMGLVNPLVVTDRGSRDLPFIARLQTYLSEAGLSSALFFEISPNPRDDEISAGREMFRAGGHDAIIAIGGGSAMDGGKSICLTARNDIELWAFEFAEPTPEIHPDQAFPTLITIPTTAGTGAETESTAMVTHVEKGMKFCVWHPDLKPSLALLDPELTVGLPRHLTAWTGADAMTHAIEAYLVPGFHPLCDGLALEGLALVNKWLPVAVAEPQNMAARGGMLVGSCLAGIAFLKGLGLVHAISHMIGAEYNTQHGLTNAIILPVVLRFNLPGMETKVKCMADAMDLEDPSVDGFIAAVERILDGIEIPTSLGKIDVPLECAERIARKAMIDSAAATNPRAASIEEIRALTEAAIIQARPGVPVVEPVIAR